MKVLAILAKAAKVFNIPTVLTTVAAKTFSGGGDLFPGVQAVFPNIKPIDRTSMNSSADKSFKAAVEKTGRKKLVMAALWTEVCLVMPAIDAINEGYEVCIVTDASGGTSTEAHNMAIQRLIQGGAVPVTWLRVMLEWQRDWAHQDTYGSVLKVAEEHAGAYSIGIRYANQSSANMRAKPGLNQPREFVVPPSGGTLPSMNHSGWSRYHKPSLHTFRRVPYV